MNQSLGSIDRLQVPLQRLQQCLSPHLWQILTTASHQATEHGWNLYLVGGVVRDILLAIPGEALPIVDVDLVVDGDRDDRDSSSQAASNAGVKLAQSLQHRYPHARLQIHRKFQTADLSWQESSEFGTLLIDIATARAESYPYPAANPNVEASSIEQDLYRRDFTINAMAICLTGDRAGALIDLFNGQRDLQSRQIRVLHPNSFIDDPTRMYRAVRFAVRLGFQLEPQTELYLREAIGSSIYEQVKQAHSKVPALQARLKGELKYILETPTWKSALKLLEAWGALQCIHPTLKLQRSLRSMEGADRLLKGALKRTIAKSESPKLLQLLSPRWQLLLEILLAQLGDRASHVATYLQLPTDSINRLHRLSQDQADVSTSLATVHQPSQIVSLLSRYDPAILGLIAATSPRPIRQPIWRYLTCWAEVKSPLDGTDLRQLGYKPGQQFRQILDDLLSATLDGIISTSKEAKQFLDQHYPLE